MCRILLQITILIARKGYDEEKKSLLDLYNGTGVLNVMNVGTSDRMLRGSIDV